MVFQNYALYPHMTVYKNMAFGLKLRRVPEAEIDQRVREAAKILGIEHLLDRKPKALSGGQRQRVAVGRAIVREPKAFLFDEPLSQPRRQAARRDAGGAQAAAPAAADDDDLRDARPGRGDDAGRPDRGDEGRHRSSRRTRRWTIYEQPVNRFVAGFVGHAADELPRRAGSSRTAGTLYFDEGASRIRLPERQLEGALARYESAGRWCWASGRRALSCRRRGQTWAGKGNAPARRRVSAWSSRWATRWMCTCRRRRTSTMVCRVDAHTRLREGRKMPHVCGRRSGPRFRAWRDRDERERWCGDQAGAALLSRHWRHTRCRIGCGRRRRSEMA